MRRFPSMKIGLASFLSCLALVLGLYTTTGTASAHTASHPFINVVSGFHRFGNCLSFLLEGGGFTPNHHVDLFARASGGASIDPNRVRANGNGRFLVDATACGNEQFSNCGSFIESTNFCGFNLPQNDFCSLPGFGGFGSCFFGSAMRALPCPTDNNPCCQQDQFLGNEGNLCQCNQDQFLGNEGNLCQCNNELPECFRFHRIPVFDFCRFHEQERFPFCFRFFPQEFPIQVGITAVDEHSGRRAHAFVSFGF